jgi:hypothetical protein
MPAANFANYPSGSQRWSIPQLAEGNTPRRMDAAGECLLYDGYKAGNVAYINRVSER